MYALYFCILSIFFAMPKICCICRTTPSSRFSPTELYESSFESCFGVLPSPSRSGLICEGCRKSVYSHRQDSSLQFINKVDSRKGTFATKKCRKCIPLGGKKNEAKEDDDRNGLSISSVASFESLPDTALSQIFGYLTPAELLNVGTLNKSFFLLSREPVLWQNLTVKHFSEDNEIPNIGSCWCDLFVYYKQHSRLRMTLAKLEEKEEEMAKQATKSLCLEAQLQSLTNTTEGELSTFEERVFCCVLRRKEKTSTDGFIRVKNSRGRPHTLVPVKVPEVSSKEASSRTVRERCRFQEKILNASVSVTGQSEQEKETNINLQRTALIRRDKDSYAKCASDAGIKILAKFTPSQAAGFKKEMSLESWRLVKRAIESVTGVDILGTEQNLREEMAKSYFEFECGKFTTTENECQKTVTFVRVINIAQVNTKTVEQLQSCGELTCQENIPGNCLKLLVFQR